MSDEQRHEEEFDVEEVIGEDADTGAPPSADDQLAQLENEKHELFSRLQRVSADYQNYVRRAEQNVIDAGEFARVEVFRRIVPVLDHFDTALGQQVAGEEAKSMATGMRIVRDELLKVMQQMGVERIDAKQGDDFDPHLHEALMQQPVEGLPANRIAQQLQPGYRYKHRIIRPAKVAVTV